MCVIPFSPPNALRCFAEKNNIQLIGYQNAGFLFYRRRLNYTIF